MFTFEEEGSDEYILKEAYAVPDTKRPSFEEAMKGTYKKIGKGHQFGPSWSTHWVRITLTVPEKFKKYDHVEFHWDSNCEALVWSEDGEPLQGLTGGGERVEYLFPRKWLEGGKHVFYVEVACNGMFGNGPGDIIQPPDPNRHFGLSKADIVAPNLEALALNIDFWILGGIILWPILLSRLTLLDAAREFPNESWEKHKALTVGNDIVNAFVKGDQESIKKCRKLAQQIVGDKVDSADVYNSDKEVLVTGIGHCHIDSCWLWPFAETKRKVARSWVSQMNLSDRYPEHRFTASSAQQYKWLETLYPKAFDRLKEHVKRGTFQPIGGSWVEHDTNLPSGESLVRQFLLGQRYFESRFGKRCQTFWLPDTFGYSAQLPQLCRLAGMTRFLTQKLSWNNINKFPHTTFNWIALDGSQVLCHMPPSETYTAQAHFGDVKRSVSQHKSMNEDNTSLLVFGHGDGGGGPTAEMLEKLRRIRGLSDTIGLLPRVKMGDSVDNFFQKLEEKEVADKKFVTWYGELYFELHRGTYTTQSNNKKNNRKAEIFMRDIEYLATLASLHDSDYVYPKKDIDDLWELICLCHFHDCLPGSSINMVYRESDEYYHEVFTRGKELLKDAAGRLGLSEEKTAGAELVALNSYSWPRTEVVKVPAKSTVHVDQVQGEEGFAVLSTESLGLASPVMPTATATVQEVEAGVFLLKNDNLEVKVQGGRITSLYDKQRDREVIAEGKSGNQLVLFDDKPLYWQAWDVEVYHLESREELPEGKVSILSTGPLVASVLVETQISPESWIKTTISLSAAIGDSGSYVQFDNELEWRESKKFLKVEFPVDAHNTEATYETQYGLVRRPTHYNTSWDMAKFEVCTHKFSDLSEHGFGVSILNDSKYGFATVGNLMRLSLIRAPKAPDDAADMGRHHFKYAIYPHGGLGPHVVKTAIAFNHPLKPAYIDPSRTPKAQKLISSAVDLIGAPSVILDFVKRGEDDEDVSTGGLPVRKGRSVILRTYESMGGRAVGRIVSGLKVRKAFKVNLLEDDLEELKIEEGEGRKEVKVVLRPFEVATFRLELED